MKRTYVGAHQSVLVAGRQVERGQTVDLPAEIVEGLAPADWQEPESEPTPKSEPKSTPTRRRRKHGKGTDDPTKEQA